MTGHDGRPGIGIVSAIEPYFAVACQGTGGKALQPGGPCRLLDSLRERMGCDRQHILRAKHGDGERCVHRLMGSGQGR